MSETLSADELLAIAQADYLCRESGRETLDELWADDPDLFVTLAAEWWQQQKETLQ